MACRPCENARRQLAQSAQSLDIGGVAKAIATGIAINFDKARGVDVNAKYAPGKAEKAKPYRRTVK